MISGRVSANVEAIVAVALQLAAKRRRTVKAVVDTGFTGFLSLPPAITSQLELTFQGKTRMVLADGRTIRCDVFAGTILWNGRRRRVVIESLNSDPLIGMALLKGFDLHMRVRSGGIVRIERIPDLRSRKA